MVVIDISELKKFLSNSKNIKDRNILPILSYVKLECKNKKTTLTKTNLDSFVTCEVDGSFKEDVSMLIDEKTLSATVAYSDSNILTISISGDNIILDDGTKKNRCKSQPVNLFPAIQNPESAERVSLSTEIISALTIAKNHTIVANDKIRWECFVHVLKAGNKTLIGGANGMILFLKTFNENIPPMSLTPETVSAISGFFQAEYSSTEKYDFFECLGTTYGFIKSEMKPPDLGVLLGRLKTDDAFSVKRKDLISFCEMVISMNGSSIIPEVYLQDEGNDISICFDGVADAQGSQRTLKTIGKKTKFPTTIFQPRNLIIVMKDLATDTVTLSKISGNMVVTSDEDKEYKGSIMELAKI